jgi:hypothetical protein
VVDGASNQGKSERLQAAAEQHTLARNRQQPTTIATPFLFSQKGNTQYGINKKIKK